MMDADAAGEAGVVRFSYSGDKVHRLHRVFITESSSGITKIARAYGFDPMDLQSNFIQDVMSAVETGYVEAVRRRIKERRG
jgi:hypothetical protein